MGIIGVVAALTLPNLNSSTGEKEKVTKVKKIYQNLEDAYGRATAVYGPFDEWFKNDTTSEQKSKRFGERMTEFMKVSKDCGTSVRGCFSSIYDAYAIYRIITADGTSISFAFSVDGSSSIGVDIDGPRKGSFEGGKDRFSFLIEAAGIVPACNDDAFADLLANVKSGGGRQCAQTWIINYDNMDYLKLDSEGKCPNGTTPTESNPRCK